MKLFKSEADLKKFLLEKSRVAVARAQGKVAQEMVGLAEDFYAGHNPVWEGYKRTEQLKMVGTDKFIHPYPIEMGTNSVESSVRLDAENLSYATGRPPEGEQVMAAAVQGLHGAIGDDLRYVTGNVSGARIWDEGLQAKATDILLDEIKSVL